MNSQSYLSEVSFKERHLDLNQANIDEMLSLVGVKNIDELIEKTIPNSIRIKELLNLPKAQSEVEFLDSFKDMMSENKIFKNHIGYGYFGTHTPKVILRNVFENPGWYTAYTPYQAEIAQGRLEALINYQTLVTDLTGMEIANASLLDEATAAAEAVTMLFNVKQASKVNANKVLVSNKCFAQVIDVIKTRAKYIGIQVEIVEEIIDHISDPQVYAFVTQYPDAYGQVEDLTQLMEKAKQNNVLSAVGSDLLSLTLLKSPGEFGADVVYGSSQRFGVPIGFGGPHAAFFATKESFKRSLPGRLIGQSIDAQGNKAFRMALQTREQHIRREKATSNICTAQVLLSVMASFYAVYHGPKGLKQISERVHSLTCILNENLKKLGFNQLNNSFFDTLSIFVESTEKIKILAQEEEINFRYESNLIGISIDETTTIKDIEKIIQIFANSLSDNIFEYSTKFNVSINPNSIRKSLFLTHSVFNQYHTEHEILRYIKQLESKDLSMVHSMIALGSCTMKLNATTEMIPVTWLEVGNIHPFAPKDQTIGYQKMINNLSDWLCKITGFNAVSLQPNSGAQGEYAGLMTIKSYLESQNQSHRKIALIPTSAHGTNPASAVMAGFKVVLVKCDQMGNIDVEHLKEQALAHKDDLACLMVTYPSTHGVFEESIQDICALVHQLGGQVYMDGANMNAQVGLTSPANIGADVCHLNLHKTFCIPHGGGGPGMGPIGVAKHLSQHLPQHFFTDVNISYSVSSAPFGSASILPISYAYIAMMGAKGIKESTEIAILNANYIKARLENHYPVLYSGKNGYCAHEMILDCRGFKISTGIEVEDIAKRLMDYGFHAPTVSFPVAGTLMIEPTESESKSEMDRFCDAMISIREEIREIEQGIYDKSNNVLKNAPHTSMVVIADQWQNSYSREKAAFPLDWVRKYKFWPSVSRIDGAYGDRNLICTCEPIEVYQEI